MSYKREVCNRLHYIHLVGINYEEKAYSKLIQLASHIINMLLDLSSTKTIPILGGVLRSPFLPILKNLHNIY